MIRGVRWAKDYVIWPKPNSPTGVGPDRFILPAEVA
jgi:hypothetical protein